MTNRYSVARRRMVTEQLIAGGIKDQRVLDAMSKVCREKFVGKGMEDQAYEDRPLPIGMAQTISQPLIVAMMTEQLKLKGDERILEIGTGSGYQAAVLSLLVKEVFTIERLSTLSIRARQALYKESYMNVQFRIGDGSLGWPEKAPFDGIIVTAGAPIVPEKLCQQLSNTARLVVPVGGEDVQSLLVIQRTGNSYKTTRISGCRFVKLVGEDAWGE